MAMMPKPIRISTAMQAVFLEYSLSSVVVAEAIASFRSRTSAS